ncbi:hypothetical protein Tmar_0508 [Thermaerobacter marianensis DSM 12885]|uniref:Uncharacterized protein n=1 Tax=Thermaerobacter marianensis (strain ATCC 700841 / DSM 12885 / JCM 10246 / 7p75a) TaxID=644966 RepID=E6SGZ8_THEM7|nr:DUF4260 family protein [Thermaerobacter marianensis]ADU50629.1 hypothetical protein Tmar_0508 [Thermaerobacter marianensis DSM 12885]
MARVWLRLEGLLLALAALVAYGAAGGGWAAFIVFFVLPDGIGLVPFALAARGTGGRWPRDRLRPAGTGGRRRRGAQDAQPLVAPRWFLLYNAAHSTALPLLLALLGWWATGRVYLPLLGWLTHIGLDRALGLGLKLYPYLRSTHLQLEEAPLRPRW